MPIVVVALCKGIRILESGNFCLLNAECKEVCFSNVESWGLESGIQLKESGIPLMIGIQ